MKQIPISIEFPLYSQSKCALDVTRLADPPLPQVTPPAPNPDEMGLDATEWAEWEENGNYDFPMLG